MIKSFWMSAFLLLFAGEAFPDPLRLPIIQGPTNERETQIAILVPRNRPVSAYIRNGKSIHLAKVSHKIDLPDLEYDVVHFIFRDLPQAEFWNLVVERAGEQIDRRTLQSVRAKKDEPLRFAVVSCTKDEAQDLYPTIWAEMTAQKPDFLLYVGDTVYIDAFVNRVLFPLKAKKIVERHIEARERFHFFRQEHLIPVYAIWDDHDFGLNNSDRNFSHRDFTISVFRAFFPDYEITGFHRGPGISKAWTIGEQSFVLLDNRFFQNQKVKPAVYLGKEQTGWLSHFLDKAGPVTWIAGGSQFFGAYVGPGESFEGGFESEWERFLPMLSEKETKVAFISGDIHATELMKIEKEILGYETFEFTASGMIRKSFGINKWKYFDNPRKLYQHFGSANYGIVSSLLKESGDWQLRFQAFTSGSQILYEHEAIH